MWNTAWPGKYPIRPAAWCAVNRPQQRGERRPAVVVAPVAGGRPPAPVLAAGPLAQVEDRHAAAGVSGRDGRRHPGRAGPITARSHGAGPASATGAGRTAPRYANPEPFSVVMTSPSRASARQARTPGTPLTVTRQSKHTPIPQVRPRGSARRRVCRQPQLAAGQERGGDADPGRDGPGRAIDGDGNACGGRRAQARAGSAKRAGANGARDRAGACPAASWAIR